MFISRLSLLWVCYPLRDDKTTNLSLDIWAMYVKGVPEVRTAMDTELRKRWNVSMCNMFIDVFVPYILAIKNIDAMKSAREPMYFIRKVAGTNLDLKPAQARMIPMLYWISTERDQHWYALINELSTVTDKMADFITMEEGKLFKDYLTQRNYSLTTGEFHAMLVGLKKTEPNEWARLIKMRDKVDFAMEMYNERILAKKRATLAQLEADKRQLAQE